MGSGSAGGGQWDKADLRGSNRFDGQPPCTNRFWKILFQSAMAADCEL
jgi:hypothetical protein